MTNFIKFFKEDKLLDDAAILFIGMIIVNILNFIFQIIMGRFLPTNEYALLCTLLNLLNVFIIPLGVINTTLVRTTQILVQQNRAGDIPRLIRKTLLITLFFGGIFSLLCFIFKNHVALFLNIDRIYPVYILGFILIGIFSRSVFDSALEGTQNFKDCAIISIIGWGTRLTIGTILVLNFSNIAENGLIGHGLGIYIAIIVSILYFNKRLSSNNKTLLDLPPIKNFIGASFWILLGLSIITFSDIVLVKNIYPEKVGEFSYAATLGRLVIFVPQALIISMFPKVVSDNGLLPNHFIILKKTLFFVLVITIFVAIIFYYLVPFFMNLMFGLKSLSNELLFWCRLFAISMIPVSLCLVCTRYILAQKNYLAGCLVPIGAVFYLFLNFIFPLGIVQMLIYLFFVSLIISIIIYIVSYFDFKKLNTID